MRNLLETHSEEALEKNAKSSRTSLPGGTAPEPVAFTRYVLDIFASEPGLLELEGRHSK